MEVFRMENDEGFGPFNMALNDAPGMVKAVPWLKLSPSGHGVGPKNTWAAMTHPHHMKDIPDTDLGGDDMGVIPMLLGSPWRVGVKDMRQFYHWFPTHSLNWFAHQGFHLSAYEVPKSAVKMGTWQLMFDINKAHLLRTEPLNELAKEAA